MTPFNDHRKTYLTACISTALLYAYTLGGDLSSAARPADAALYGTLLYLMGIISWNIFRLALPPRYALKYRRMFVAGPAVAICLLTIATESLALYLLFPSQIETFLHTLPARGFITALLFLLLRLLYTVHSSAKSNNPTPVAVADVPPRKTPPPPSDRITVRSGQKIKIIPIEEIVYIKADGDYISIKTSEGVWLKEQTMKYTEDRLPADRFVRIHRSYIVNVNHISRITRYGEKQQVELHNREKIKISAARYQTLRQILGF
jgi:DNA-binding LytR/AlgR family response regulator